MRPYLLIKHLLIQCLFLLSLSSIAESASHGIDNTIYMNQSQNTVESAENIFYFEDTTHQQSLDNIQALDENRWEHLPNNIANFGFSDSAYWFSFELNNNGSEDLSLYVHINYALLDKIDFYSLEKGQSPEHIQVGDMQAYHERPVDYPTFLLPLELKEKQSKRILVRIETSGTLQVPISIWQKEAFLLNTQDSLFLYGCFLSAY